MALDLNMLEINYKESKSSKTIARCPVCSLRGEDNKGSNLYINNDSGKFACSKGCSNKDIFKIAGLKGNSSSFVNSNGSVGKVGKVGKVEIDEDIVFNDVSNSNCSAGVKVVEAVKKPNSVTKDFIQSWLLQRASKREDFISHINSVFYDYKNKDGDVVGSNARINFYRTKDGKQKRDKDFRMVLKDGKDGDNWIFSNSEYTKSINFVWPLFELPRINNNIDIWYFEGEKCASAGISIGLNCTTKPPCNNVDYSPLLGRTVILIPDFDINDNGEYLNTGYDKALKTMDMLKRLDSSTNVIVLNSIKNVDNDNAVKNTKKYDIADYIEENRARGIQDKDILAKVLAMNVESNFLKIQEKGSIFMDSDKEDLNEYAKRDDVVTHSKPIEVEITRENAIESCLNDLKQLWENDASYKEARETLKRRFGAFIDIDTIKKYIKEQYGRSYSKDCKKEQSAINGQFGGRPQNFGCTDVAIEFLKQYYTGKDGLKTLLFLTTTGDSGEWYEYIHQRWLGINTATLKSTIQSFLDDREYKTTSHSLHEVFTELKSHNLCGVSVQKPCFLNEIDVKKQYKDIDKTNMAEDCMAFKNNVVVDIRRYVQFLIDKDNGLNPKADYKRDLNAHFFSDNYVDYNFEEDAACPNWIDGLKRIQCDDNILAIQRMMGLSLIKESKYHVFFAMIGTSRGGKGEIIKTWKHMIGPHNNANIPIKNLCNESNQDNQDLLTAKINIADEIEDDCFINGLGVNLIKQIACGDQVQFKIRYESAANRNVTARLILSANKMPQFNDKSKAMYLRLRMIPFTVNLDDEGKIILDFFNTRLKPELPGILQWCIRGLKDIIKTEQEQNAKGLSYKYPECVAGLIDKNKFREKNDPILKFFNEYYIKTNNAKDVMPIEDMYKDYIEQVTATDKVKTLKAFKNDLEDDSGSTKLVEQRIMRFGVRVPCYKFVAKKTTEDFEKTLDEYRVKDVAAIDSASTIMEGIIEDSTPATTTATTTYTHKNDSEDIAIEQEQGDTAMNAFDDVTLDKNNVGEAEDIFGDGKKTVDDVCKSSNSSYKNGNKTEGTKVDDEFVNYDDFFGDEQPIIEDSTTSTTSTTKATEATETPKTPTASTTPKTVQPIDDSDIEFAPTTTTPTTATTTTAPKKPFVIGGITFEG